MGQELLLKVDVTTKPSPIDKKQSSVPVSDREAPESKPFSSALDDQMDKQTVQTQEPEKDSEADDVELATIQNETEGKAEEFVDEDGNSLPIDSELVTIELTEQDDVEVNALLTDDNDSKIPVAVAGDLVEKSVKIKPQQDKSDGSVDVVLQDLNVKLKQKPILRSDILNALPSKQSGEGIKSDVSVLTSEKMMANALLDKPVEKNGESKITNVLSQQKIELPPLNIHSERSVNNLVSALTTTGGASTANTIMQSATVGQPVLAMQPSIQSEAWGRVLSSRVVWMAREGIQQAELRMNPANLGPVEVKLHMNNEQANVSFVAQHAATRDALEQALPKLRESFQENGMDLGHADVSDQASEQQNNDNENANNASTSSGLNGEQSLLESESDIRTMESNELELGVSVFA